MAYKSVMVDAGAKQNVPSEATRPLLATKAQRDAQTGKRTIHKGDQQCKVQRRPKEEQSSIGRHIEVDMPTAPVSHSLKSRFHANLPILLRRVKVHTLEPTIETITRAHLWVVFVASICRIDQHYADDDNR